MATINNFCNILRVININYCNPVFEFQIQQKSIQNTVIKNLLHHLEHLSQIKLFNIQYTQ